MRLVFPTTLFAAILSTGFLCLLGAAGLSRSSGGERSAVANPPAKLVIDYPLEGSVFPPEITPPTFLWRDASATSTHWVVQVTFADHSDGLRIEAAGEPMHVGEIDTQVASGDEVTKLSAEQAGVRTWKPDADTWTKIKRRSVKVPATIQLIGFADADAKQPVSAGSVTISTSSDPVGAPIFYRDVPLLMSPRGAKGAIQPLPPFAVPLIKWQLRNIAEPKSRVVMENLPTCANCHSFSTDGKTLGLDLDGPMNDKGLYALVSTAPITTIRNQDVIRWSSFLEKPGAKGSEPAVKRFGFMSQISPNGRYVITSIGPPGLEATHKSEGPAFAPGIADRLYSINYKGPPFNQVFYPTRGILAFYDREKNEFQTLPGADDPQFVQTSAFWSPDGKYLVYSRAMARDPNPPGSENSEYANDPHETQIQYDLYRIPFNEGRGGKAEPVEGASGNGMSNNFPKVSPDGRWIVFVQNRNGLLMRPDSQLYIVPFAGGKARLMKCNTSRMNSWHTFSPNGRWLAFSSKARSSYTQLMLTHIDAKGNDSPAIIVDNTTAANRAVNIPEFLNVPPGGLDKIDPQATEFYRLFNQAYAFIEESQWAQAIPILRKALEEDPAFAVAHYALATALVATGQEHEAMEEYRKACTLDTQHAPWFDHYAVSLERSGDLDGAAANLRKSLALDPSNPGTEDALGTVLLENRQEEGYAHLRKAIELDPKYADAHNHLGWSLAGAGQLKEALDELQKAVALRPDSVEYLANLGLVTGASGDYPGALAIFQKAVDISKGKDWRSLDMLAKAYSLNGRPSSAVETEEQALSLAIELHDTQVETTLRSNLEHYERESEGAPSK